jgi:hypothetical protein
MPLDLSKLSDAVKAVAGVAAENAALKADIAKAQGDVDALTVSLLAATTSPAEAVGVAAVAAALAPEVAQAAVPAPVVALDPVNGAPVKPVLTNP